MSKIKKIFFNWLKSYESLDKIDAAAWDEQITDLTTQKVLRQSTQAQSCYAFIESNLARQYAKLIATQLNNVFLNLSKADLRVPKGFGDKSRASVSLSAYFELKDLQECFMRADILKADKDARVHAFRRWITVIEILVSKHHYEAAFALLLNMSTLDDQYHLSASLPSYSRHALDNLLKLISPIGNFRVLRQCMNEAKAKMTEPVIMPLAILSKDITSLNEHLNDEEAKSLNEVGEGHPAYNNFATKELMLDEFMRCQRNEASVVPEHLQRLFDRLTSPQDTLTPNNEPVNLEPIPTRTDTASNLYSHKLHPSLWSRRGRMDKTEASYWKDLLQVVELPSPLR